MNIPAGWPDGRLLPYGRCPECGDVANVWDVDGATRYICRKGHRGPFVVNDLSDPPGPATDNDEG